MRNAKNRIKKVVFATALGWAGVTASGLGVCAIALPKKCKKAVEREMIKAGCRTGSAEREAEALISTSRILNKAVRLLRAYFSGETVAFDLPLDIRYYTVFQRAVWRAATKIPFGETRSYAWIAARVRNPDAARAVGQAMGANPIPVIIP